MKNLSTTLWLGFVTNLSKSITYLTQQMEFSGFVTDTVTMTVTLLPHKMESIRKEASHLLESGSIQIRTLVCFIGILVVTKPAIPLASLHFRALQDLKSQALQCNQTSDQIWIQLSQEAKTDLQWWKTQLSTHYSTPFLKPEASIVIETDASKKG